jgi:hypothetical protein
MKQKIFFTYPNEISQLKLVNKNRKLIEAIYNYRRGNENQFMDIDIRRRVISNKNNSTQIIINNFPFQLVFFSNNNKNKSNRRK